MITMAIEAWPHPDGETEAYANYELWQEVVQYALDADPPVPLEDDEGVFTALVRCWEAVRARALRVFQNGRATTIQYII